MVNAFRRIERVELPPKQLASKIKDFGYHKITVSFEQENFLLFDYPYDEDMHNTLIVENFNEDLLFAKSYNCGYGGVGPGMTEEVLIDLGLTLEDADKLKWFDGFQITFNEDGTYTSPGFINNLPFRRNGGKVDLESATIVRDLIRKRLFFIEPEGKALSALLNTLNLLKISCIKAYIGEDNSGLYDFDMPYTPDFGYGLQQIQKERCLKGSFIVFEAKPFDVICFVGEQAPASIINTLAVYATGHPLLHEGTLGEHIIMNPDYFYDNKRLKKWSKALKRTPNGFVVTKELPDFQKEFLK